MKPGKDCGLEEKQFTLTCTTGSFSCLNFNTLSGSDVPPSGSLPPELLYNTLVKAWLLVSISCFKMFKSFSVGNLGRGKVSILRRYDHLYKNAPAIHVH